MSLYLLGSWGTEHWQKGTLWLSPRFSFFLCFLIAAEPCERRVHWMALWNYLYCPHTRFVHLSDPSALKNCQLYKEKGIGTLRKIQDRRGGDGKREKEAHTLGNAFPRGPWSRWCQANTKKGFRKVMLRRRQKSCPFRLCSPSIKVWQILNGWFHLTGGINFFPYCFLKPV